MLLTLHGTRTPQRVLQATPACAPHSSRRRHCRGATLPTCAAATPQPHAPLSRRAACGAAAAAAIAAASPPVACARTDASPPAAAPPTAVPEVTQRVYMDFGLCDGIVRAERALGAGSGALCEAPAPLGRVVIGLYGNVVPQSVANFVALCTGAAGGGYARSVVARVRPGEFIEAGRPGSTRLGEVEAPNLAPNPELTSAAAFQLRHRAPGTVSLALAADEDDSLPLRGPNTTFRITTGPGPVPSLDGENIVVGRVLSGLQVVAAVARVPTYAPLPSQRAWNTLAAALRDGRAQNARAAWSKPRQAIVITACGVLTDGQ